MSGVDPSSKSDDLSAERDRLVRSHLEEIIASSVFAGSKRSQDFLRLVVEHGLAGRFDSLRERMIGVEMFGRPVAYDTANDAVVRVKATEVRRKLAQFYREAASPQPVRIELPTGSYIPKFHWEPPVQAHAEAPPPASVEPPPAAEKFDEVQEETSHSTGGTFRRRPYLLVIGLLGLSLLATIGYWGFKGLGKQSNAKQEIRSMAILPLQNLSGDPKQEYFADGMTEELIANLGQIGPLRVISRTSVMTYKGTKKTLPEVAHELGVDAVVEGSVWREGNRVRIAAQLIDARTDQHLWAHTYDRNLTSVLALQGEVAQAIADEIRIELTPEAQARLARVRPVYAEGQELYLKGVELLHQGDPRKAVGYLQDAIDKDPGYAPAHVALAGGYGWLGEAGLLPYSEAFHKQRTEAAKAIELDEALPGGHAELAGALMNLNWDWVTPEKEFKRALELNPNSAPIHSQYAFYLMRLGRLNEAIAHAKLNLQLDPVSSRSYTNLGFIDYFARQYDQALANIQKADEIDTNPPEFIYPRAIIYAEKGMYDEAIREFQKLGQQPHALGHMGNVYARMGRAAEADELISRLKEHVQADGIGRYEIAFVYAGLGKKDEAFNWLEKSYGAHDKGLTYLKIDPCMDPLRSDPRFHDLLRRVGLPS
jgi:TolB-like protein/Tfp pilus assembly protein PilF